jgi:ATP-binding cassette subfamily B protein
MQRMGVRAPILFVGGICLSMILEPVLALVLLTMLPFVVLVIFLVSRNGIRLYKKLQAAGDIMIRIVRENATGIRVIKALSKEAHEKRRFQEANAEITERERRVNIIMGITNPTIFLFLNLGFTAVIVVGAYRVNIGLTHPGEILAFLTYFTIILNATLTITRMFTVYSQGLASGDRISDVLSLQCAQPPHRRNHEESPYHVEFRNVSFSYDGQTDLLKDVNFAIKRGETLGIIGETGCGKSTVVQLLLRFYDPRKGDIRINGDDARGIPAEEFFPMFGVAFQNDVLFADTVLRNVDFGRGLTPEAVKSAVNRAQAADFVDAFADGYEHLLTPRGTNISGGQRQRLIIARALAARPQILILDDSFSALDYRTDANIRHMLRDELTGATAIIVATRISSIVHANHILVLEQGKVAGYGTHEKLLEYCAIYGEICESQEFRKNSRVK